jgi:hypothetical protein
MVEQQDAHPRMQQAHLGELDRSEDMQVVQSAVHFHSTWVVSHLFAVSVCGMLQDTFCLIAISVSTLSATYLDFRVFRQSVGQYSRMGAKHQAPGLKDRGTLEVREDRKFVGKETWRRTTEPKLPTEGWKERSWLLRTNSFAVSRLSEETKLAGRHGGKMIDGSGTAASIRRCSVC